MRLVRVRMPEAVDRRKLFAAGGSVLGLVLIVLSVPQLLNFVGDASDLVINAPSRLISALGPDLAVPGREDVAASSTGPPSPTPTPANPRPTPAPPVGYADDGIPGPQPSVGRSVPTAPDPFDAAPPPPPPPLQTPPAPAPVPTLPPIGPPPPTPVPTPLPPPPPPPTPVPTPVPTPDPTPEPTPTPTPEPPPPDSDGDGIPDDQDNCPTIFDPTNLCLVSPPLP